MVVSPSPFTQTGLFFCGSSGSSCPSGTKPVYRLYNNRFQFHDSNHRFTTLLSEAQALQAQGWTLEGVAFCAINS